jgi:hypothetical protein
MIMGQDCGIAAKQLIENGILSQDIDTEKLIDELINQGVNGIGGKTLVMNG